MGVLPQVNLGKGVFLWLVALSFEGWENVIPRNFKDFEFNLTISLIGKGAELTREEDSFFNWSASAPFVFRK